MCDYEYETWIMAILHNAYIHSKEELYYSISNLLTFNIYIRLKTNYPLILGLKLPLGKNVLINFQGVTWPPLTYAAGTHDLTVKTLRLGEDGVIPAP